MADNYLTDMLIGNSLIFASSRLRESITISVVELNLNFEQAFILRELWLLKDCAPINQTALSDTLRLDAVTTSRNLHRLEKESLISRQKKMALNVKKLFYLPAKANE